MQTRLRELYYGHSDRAHRFRYALLAFDLTTILFVIVTSFFPHGPVIEGIDMLIGVVILADFIAHLWATRRRFRHFTKLSTWADLVAMVSFLAPIAGEGFGFLRILRTLRLLHTYQLTSRLRQDFRFFKENQQVIMASVNLLVFLFIMTGVIYATQEGENEQIGNYADALYFTVTTLTTTGFGDITLEGTSGRLLAVAVMIVGITLFLRLATALFRPPKVRHECSNCGLLLHDTDAVHCKHCGEVVHIETEGTV
ncbi:potassium channel family protein [Maritimibacter dapengensis]|uniref:Potassium channel family protein n=1 Tax=Maritimibacter dapengensis TaxID=2836868 RepID=A0ABS6T2V7_9RHOB|nr:potassium channel family protein [Maritimibacter dapengensis]MBV7379038.1 potassium channel family protein [Maritimibacter dapengensis]